jgi:putative acetyltransferase
LNIKQLKSTDVGVAMTLKAIDDLMNAAYPAECNVMLPIEEIDESNVYFVGLYQGELLAACGAVVIKHDVDYYGELKRIYVHPDCRGQGLSVKIVDHLISYATEQDFDLLRLETGNKQLAAIQLYEKMGFTYRSRFGLYDYDPYAVYMERSVAR